MKLVKRNNEWFPSLFGEFFPENRLDTLNYESFSTPAVNIQENFTNFVIEMAIPGLKKENIAIEIEKDVLTVSSQETSSAEHKEEVEGTRYTRKEFNYASFERSFTLPDTINKEAVKGAYEDGILRIELPKVKEAQDIKRMVEIS